ncbi:MAG TPA: XRE family transcriptional regulator [Opitutaceae bacterium]|nr:XRE family transcriptional regulator [Opitutaceae bacterium]
MIISLNPNVLRWARTRAGLKEHELAEKLHIKPDNVTRWEMTGELKLTQAEKLADKTYTPLGLLFLSEPPEEKLPISDFRTVGDEPVASPSTELLDTIQMMQARQAWMREYLIGQGFSRLPFVGSARHGQRPEAVAASMRAALKMTDAWAKQHPDWSSALFGLRHLIEDADILIFINGVVGNNTHRPLKTSEFRGFALCDDVAPLIFINNADAKSAQMFTIAHELAHIWLGIDGVSNLPKLQAPELEIEQFCNAVAAEFLVPSEEISAVWKVAEAEEHPYGYLARVFKVSPIVAARRAQDLGFIDREEFFNFLNHYQAQQHKKPSTGGDFWKTNNVRIDPRFGVSVVRAAKEGQLLYTDAYRLTGLKSESFSTYAKTFGY